MCVRAVAAVKVNYHRTSQAFQGFHHHLLDDILNAANSQLQSPPAQQEKLLCIINADGLKPTEQRRASKLTFLKGPGSDLSLITK